MKLQSLPVSDLIPAPYNPRISLQPGDVAFEKLKRSLDEFDLVQPIVWNQRTGHVVGGHQRLEVLKHQGCKKIDCVVVDLPLEREQALNITLNNTSVASDWAPDKLVDLLDELHELPDFDATLTGFDEQQLQDLLLAPDPSCADGWQPPDDDESSLDRIRATLEVPLDRWEHVKQALDQILGDEPSLTLHVRLPTHT